MNTFYFLTLNGLTMAALLFIMASGLTLAFGLMRVVNLAHGAFYLLGGYIGVQVIRDTGSLTLGILAGGLAALAGGLLMERFLLQRVRGMDLSEALLTIAVGLIIADALLVVYGGQPVSLPLPRELRAPVDLGVMMYPYFRVLIMIFAVLLGIALWLVMTYTRIGAAIRAGVDDRETAMAQGINVPLLFGGVFAVASFLAGIAGVVGTSYMSLTQGLDVRVLMLSLVVIIIGGMGSLKGAAVGALITGMVSSFATGYLPQFALFFLFLPMTLILVFRPQGLFGRTA
ncbi:branched-chain amino acid ABC transporter permease [Billgrantia desiderata]|uniref:Branched-chain amino acid ABC transporter permease n=1 Tax=Billgrantia desiderata TaxID=52021 RepID=A0ABS9B846_9GAMM|nr:branched-chain amino acid ABC transporter permease [Halomonas desiderata]MCE8043621.1 branched-chain amino acid ABC transporter permease [Halomonas desiderata]MCE8048195.1 branched-chain amino acid ABC transporter permease [Halomonas desiderata]SEG28842.1 branched-chain amino acid transport system permease protein [Halomonas desiderata]